MNATDLGFIITAILIPIVTVMIPALLKLRRPRGHIVAVDENISISMSDFDNVIMARDYKTAMRYSLKGHVLLRTSRSLDREKAEFEIVTKVTNPRQIAISDVGVIKAIFDDPLA